MKLVRMDAEQLSFEMSLEEQVFLFHLLHQYPLVPADYFPISRADDLKDQAENQRLLEAALREQRQSHRQQVVDFINDPARFVATADGAGLSVTFSRAEIEWLLQICNDLRLGSWRALGSPDLDDKTELRKLPDAARYLINMEIAGAFEMQLIHALNRDSGDADPADEEADAAE
jgi:hypothetical protein